MESINSSLKLHDLNPKMLKSYWNIHEFVLFMAMPLEIGPDAQFWASILIAHHSLTAESFKRTKWNC